MSIHYGLSSVRFATGGGKDEAVVGAAIVIATISAKRMAVALIRLILLALISQCHGDASRCWI